MEYKVKAILKDGTEHIETFESHAHAQHYIDYVMKALKDYTASAEILNRREEPCDTSK
jgi:hypothetical protein